MPNSSCSARHKFTGKTLDALLRYVEGRHIQPRRRPTPYKRATEVEEKIIASVKAGATLDGAALQHGIHPTTFLRWRKCEHPFGDNLARDARCCKCRGCMLQKKLDGALEIYKAGLLGKIQNATNRDGQPVWQAQAWILERRFHNEFAVKTLSENRHEVDIEGITNAQKLVDAILGATSKDL